MALRLSKKRFVLYNFAVSSQSRTIRQFLQTTNPLIRMNVILIYFSVRGRISDLPWRFRRCPKRRRRRRPSSPQETSSCFTSRSALHYFFCHHFRHKTTNVIHFQEKIFSKSFDILSQVLKNDQDIAHFPVRRSTLNYRACGWTAAAATKTSDASNATMMMRARPRAHAKQQQ